MMSELRRRSLGGDLAEWADGGVEALDCRESTLWRPLRCGWERLRAEGREGGGPAAGPTYWVMFVTLETSHLLRSPLNAAASLNMPCEAAHGRPTSGREKSIASASAHPSGGGEMDERSACASEEGAFRI